MATKKLTAEHKDWPPLPEPRTKRQAELVAKIYSLYADYTGHEIAQAIGQYRHEVQVQEERERAKQEIERLQKQLVE